MGEFGDAASTGWSGGAYFPRGSSDLAARARIAVLFRGLTGAIVMGERREVELELGNFEVYASALGVKDGVQG